MWYDGFIIDIVSCTGYIGALCDDMQSELMMLVEWCGMWVGVMMRGGDGEDWCVKGRNYVVECDGNGFWG